MDLNEIIRLAKILARPYMILSAILGLLLILSVCGNIYLATKSYTITVEQDNNNSDNNINQNIEG